MKKIRSGLRQLRQPKWARIAAPAPAPDIADKVAALVAKLQTPVATAALAEGAAAPRPPAPDRALDRFIADMATGVWRLRRRMVDPTTQRPFEHVRREFRHVETLLDVLAQAEVEIKDFDGQPFDPGSKIKVLEYLPKPGIARMRVQETIKPAVFFRNRYIQIGEVLVDAPAPAVASESAVPRAAADEPPTRQDPPPAPPAAPPLPPPSVQQPPAPAP